MKRSEVGAAGGGGKPRGAGATVGGQRLLRGDQHGFFWPERCAGVGTGGMKRGGGWVNF